MAEIANQKTKWFTMSPEQVAKELAVDPARGLSKTEAQSRLQKYGANVLAGKKKEPGWQKFLRQYKDFMQILLLGAAIINQVAVHADNDVAGFQVGGGNRGIGIERDHDGPVVAALDVAARLGDGTPAGGSLSRSCASPGTDDPAKTGRRPRWISRLLAAGWAPTTAALAVGLPHSRGAWLGL